MLKLVGRKIHYIQNSIIERIKYSLKKITKKLIKEDYYKIAKYLTLDVGDPS